MPPRLELTALQWLILFAEIAGTLIIVYFAARALITLPWRNREIFESRKLVATGIVTGLNFKLCATVLKTITLFDWSHIGTFAVILAIRTVVKREVTWADLRPRN